tara:strand:- start:184 stop:870 length:687 start_codon:yes stop_codon:yes gene_type:complete
MKEIAQVKSITLWIFFVPFFALNICLVLITQFHGLFPNQEDVLLNTIPYFDGGASISRTARVFPTYLIFKPAMFLTSYLLVKYWIYNKKIILNFDQNNQYVNKIFFFGVASAILLTIHSIFLGINFDNDLYKLFRRIVILLFIIFEIAAQGYLVYSYYKIKNKLIDKINITFLKLKGYLVTFLIFIGIASIPLVSMPGYKFLKHALEWDYFVGVISFYLLTFFMWKKK